jgi:hypothetical protein
MAYLSMLNILVDGIVSALGALRVVNVPKDGEPLVEKRGVGSRHGKLRRRQVFRKFGIDIVLRIGIHGIVANTVDDISVLVATTVRAILTEDIDLLIAGKERSGAIVHSHADKVFVDIGVKNAALVIVCLLARRGGSSRSGLGVDGAVVHHGHGGTSNRTTHGVHVGHVNVWIHGHDSSEVTGEETERPIGSAAATTAVGGSCSHGGVPPGGAALDSVPTWT